MNRKIIAILLSLAVCCSIFGIVPASAAINPSTNVTPSGKGAMNSVFSGTVNWYRGTGDGVNDAAFVENLVATASPDYYLINGESAAETKGYKDLNRTGSYTSSSSNLRDWLKYCDAENDTHQDNWYSPQTLVETVDVYSDNTRAELVSSTSQKKLRNNRQSSFAFTNGSNTGYGYDSQGAYYYTNANDKTRPASNPMIPYAYEDIVYSFATGTKVSDILFGTQYDEGYLRSSNYKVYVANDKATLFSDSNEVYHYINDGGSVDTYVQHLHFNSAISATYVGIRIMDPLPNARTYAAYYPCSRVSIMQIYGETGLTVTGGTGVDAYNKSINTARSLILYKKPTSRIKFNASNLNDKYFGISDPNVSGYEGQGGEFSLTNVQYMSRDALWGSHQVQFVEEVGGKKQIINDESRLYIQANYAFDAAAKVQKIGIYGHNSNDLTPYHFKLSFANTEAELFSSTATTYDIVNENGYHYLNITLPKAAEAKCFGIRVICGVMPAAVNRSLALDAFYGRIGHIAVEGAYVSSLNGSVTASSEVEGINASVVYDGVADKNGKYIPGTTATISVDKTELAVGGDYYVFKGWYKGDALVSSEAEYKVDLNNEIQAFVAKFDQTIEKKAVNFYGRDGKSVYSTYVALGETISASDLDAALRAANKFYGYIPAGWNDDVTSLIISDETNINVVYKRNQGLNCKVTYNGASVDADGFDAKVTLNNSSEVLWKINGEKYSIGTSAVLYTCGDMAVTTEALGSIDKNAPFVSIINTKINGTDIIAFATVYQGNKTIKKLGIKFTSGVNYDIANKDWTSAVIGNLSYVDSSVEDIDIMSVLTNVSLGKTRLLQAYAIFSDDSEVYGETVTINT